MKYRVITGAALAVASTLVAPGAILAGEGDYIGLFGGNWAGSGTIINDASPMQVGCQVVGKPTTNHLTIQGSCGVFLISVPITADVTYDPSSGRYSGVYTGGDLSARISGKRVGDTVAFTMTWTKPINADGDTQARLTIVNPGTGNLRIIIDNIKSSGPEERSSDVRLSHV